MKHGSEVKDAEVREVFKAFDTNGDGTIVKGEFREAAVALGFKPSSEELELAVRVFDFDGSGNVSYVEFIEFVKVSELAPKCRSTQ